LFEEHGLGFVSKKRVVGLTLQERDERLSDY